MSINWHSSDHYKRTRCCRVEKISFDISLIQWLTSLLEGSKNWPYFCLLRISVLCLHRRVILQILCIKFAPISPVKVRPFHFFPVILLSISMQQSTSWNRCSATAHVLAYLHLKVHSWILHWMLHAVCAM